MICVPEHSFTLPRRLKNFVLIWLNIQSECKNTRVQMLNWRISRHSTSLPVRKTHRYGYGDVLFLPSCCLNEQGTDRFFMLCGTGASLPMMSSNLVVHFRKWQHAASAACWRKEMLLLPCSPPTPQLPAESGLAHPQHFSSDGHPLGITLLWVYIPVVHDTQRILKKKKIIHFLLKLSPWTRVTICPSPASY